MAEKVAIEIEEMDDAFEIIGCEDLDSELISKPSLTYWKDVWRRFRNNKLALIGLVMLVIVVFFTIFGPAITGYDYTRMDYEIKDQGPSAEHWFGTDQAGRDLFTRVCVGGRVSIIIGLACTAVMFSIGAVLGGIAGYKGGVVDDIIMRAVEIIVSIPYLVVVIILSITLGRGMFSLILAMTLTSWGGTTRLVRGQVLQIKNQEFVLASKALGGNTKRIIAKHLLPNAMGIIMVSITFSIPMFIFSEATLSFLGIGIQPPQTSWGALAASGRGSLMFYPHQLFFPSLMIVFTMLAFNLIGDGLTDALDPKLRQ
ncbi:ABC transporter permease [Acidaminobacter sp. JC074]|uniref:ABC transporter permease n=1 Tax=Acidaminobacter sp. JC074 TaxID=2530199 RepID=UPI00216DFADE|nr:ABC transporter permease [Acidaminobacter sp. JC074]